MHSYLGRLQRVAAACVALAAAMLMPASAHAQDTGRIVGRVVDAASGAGITDVAIQVVGTTIGTTTGVDGRYTIHRVPAGTVTLQARRIGYAPKTVTGLMLDAGGALQQDISLASAAVQLTAQVVTAEAERGTVNEALDQQRNATGIVTAITREQIARSPDGDAAQAVQRVSGVTVQDGKYVFVRGLGERYTTTSLNGARLPSPEPERRVVPLDLFPAGLLQTITTQKNFTPDQPGDFSGAQVDIRTREFPLRRQLSYSVSASYNDAATGSDLPMAPTTGREWLGFAGVERRVPGMVVGGLAGSPSQDDFNLMVNSFRNAWTPRAKAAAPGASFSVTAGGNDPVLGRELGYVGSFSYSYGDEVRANEVRAYAEPTDGTREIDRFEGTTGRSSVLWGGLLNLSTMLGSSTRISLNNTYNRTADNEARRERGRSENLGLELEVDRLRFVERTMRSNQLVGEHQLGDRHELDWSLTASGVSRSEPDRSEFITVVGDDGSRYWLDGPEASVRTFGDLREDSYSASADYALRFGGAERAHQLKVGGLFRHTDRDAENQSYSLQAPFLSLENRRLPAEQIFDGRFTADGGAGFRVVPLAQGGSYSASEMLGAGYAMLEYALGERVRLVGGARVERSATEVLASPTDGRRPVFTNPVYTDVLPSAAVNVKLDERHNLRFSASQTLARPEYRELAEVQYRDVIGGENVIGNPALQRTLIRNTDARWEWYPEAGEVVSVGLFAKRFENPIERVFLATSGTRVVTFVNARAASNLGVELELRKNLGFLAEPLLPVSVFSNLTLMRSDITLGDDPRVAPEERAMVGQAPYVVNGGVTYAADGGFSATLLYNRVGRRIVSASQQPLPATYEESRDVLDVSLRFPVVGSLSGKLDARNLLDAPYEHTQGTVTRERYDVGRSLSLGFSWQH